MMMQAGAIEETAKRPAPGSFFERVGFDDPDHVRLRELQHRVRNDLHRIGALAEQQARQTQDRVARAGFERIGQHVATLARLYTDLLGHPLGGITDLAQHLAHVCAGLAESLDLSERGIRLDLDAAPSAMEADAAVSLGLAVTELILNAAEHAFPGGRGGVIAVRLAPDSDGQPGTVVVEDDGTGFTDPPGDTGGLAIARGLVRRAGAALIREPGPGTTWRITLAAAAAQDFRR